MLCYFKHVIISIHLNNSVFEMGNILYEKWVFFDCPKKVWVQGKGVYLPIVLYLYNSKILPQVFGKL